MMSISTRTRHAARLLLLLAAVACVGPAPSFSSSSPSARAERARADEERGTLSEIRERSSIILRVGRSAVLDAGGSDEGIVAQALGPDEQRSVRGARGAYRVIARKLNEYIRKHGSMTAAPEPGRADYVLYFNLLEYRRVLDRMYPYGELVVVRNRKPDDPAGARVIWRSKVMWAEDAAKEFVKQLKRTRGER